MKEIEERYDWTKQTDPIEFLTCCALEDDGVAVHKELSSNNGMVSGLLYVPDCPEWK